MAKLSMKLKQQRDPKFSTRAYTRCRIWCPQGQLVSGEIRKEVYNTW